MARSDLTIRLREEQLEFLERYAKEQGLTADAVIERYLDRLQRQAPARIHPDIKKLSGLVPREIDGEAFYADHQRRKHR